MRLLLLASVSLLPFVAHAAVGGSDNFNSNPTGVGSSFGNGPGGGGGYGDNARSFGSATQGLPGRNEYNVDTLVGVDDGRGGVTTYSVNSSYRTATKVNTSSDGFQHYGHFSFKNDRPAPKPAQRPASKPAPAAQQPQPQQQAQPQQEVNRPAPGPEMPSLQAPRLEITTERQVQPREPNKERREHEKALQAIERASVTHLKQNDSLTRRERRVARVVEDAVGMAMGAVGGRWFGGGLANHGVKGSRLAEIAKRMAPLEGAALGLTKAELHDHKRVDRMVQDVMRFTPDEARQAKDYARRQSPAERARTMDAVRDLTAANERRERQQADRQGSRQANREGGGRKGGRDKGKSK